MNLIFLKELKILDLQILNLEIGRIIGFLFVWPAPETMISFRNINLVDVIPPFKRFSENILVGSFVIFVNI
jgi:hypothetical protein